MLHEVFLVDFPAHGDGRESTPLVIEAEAGRTVTPHAGGEKIFLIIVITHTAEEGSIGIALPHRRSIRRRRSQVERGEVLVLPSGSGGVNSVVILFLHALAQEHVDGVLSEGLVIGERVLPGPVVDAGCTAAALRLVAVAVNVARQEILILAAVIGIAVERLERKAVQDVHLSPEGGIDAGGLRLVRNLDQSQIRAGEDFAHFRRGGNAIVPRGGVAAHQRRMDDGMVQGRFLSAAARAVLDGTGHAQVDAHAEPFGHVEGSVDTAVGLVVLRAHQDTALVHIAGRHVDGAPVTLGRCRYLIVLDGSRAQHFFLPVGEGIGGEPPGRDLVGCLSGRHGILHAAASPQMIDIADIHLLGHIFIALLQVHGALRALEAVVGIKSNRRLAGALLGFDEDNAAGTARSVDGRRRGIFEHLYRGDVGRIEVAHVVTRNAVNHIERTAGAVDGVDTADADGEVLTGLAAGGSR